MAEPKFKIGDLLMSRAQSRVLHGTRGKPPVLQVNEIHTQQCYAGTQVFYHCRCAGADTMTRDTMQFVEHELRPYPEPQAVDGIVPLLKTLKELLVAESDFEEANEVRVLCDKLLLARTPKE